MSSKHKPGFIENIAEKLHLIPDLHHEAESELPRLTEPGKLTDYPPPDQWDEVANSQRAGIFGKVQHFLCTCLCTPLWLAQRFLPYWASL